MHQYNTHFPADADADSLECERRTMLKSIFGQVGEGAFIEPPLSIDYGSNICIGNDFYSNFGYVYLLLKSIPTSIPALELSTLRSCRSVQIPISVYYSSMTGLIRGSLVILDCGLVYIGHNVAFGPNVSLFGAAHHTSVRSRRSGEEYAKTIVIENDCWIGGNVTIMPGVRIGKGCTIGAASVVTRSIPSFSVAVGSPARVIKEVERVED